MLTVDCKFVRVRRAAVERVGYSAALSVFVQSVRVTLAFVHRLNKNTTPSVFWPTCVYFYIEVGLPLEIYFGIILGRIVLHVDRPLILYSAVMIQ